LWGSVLFFFIFFIFLFFLFFIQFQPLGPAGDLEWWWKPSHWFEGTNSSLPTFIFFKLGLSALLSWTFSLQLYFLLNSFSFSCLILLSPF
jgi:hypothetical protein